MINAYNSKLLRGTPQAAKGQGSDCSESMQCFGSTPQAATLHLASIQIIRANRILPGSAGSLPASWARATRLYRSKLSRGILVRLAVLLFFLFYFSISANAQSYGFQMGAQSDALHTGTQSTNLQTGTQTDLLQGGTEGSLIQGGVEHQGGPINIIIVLDCSYSMKEKLGGETQKLEAAKQVLQNALARIPSDVNLGLRVFGQGSNAGGFSTPAVDCRQTALLVPLGQGNRRSIIEKVRNLKPFGMTPLEYALRQAAEDDLSTAQGTKIIMLITDGADTCGGNPCGYIHMLPLLGIHIKIDVVGLDLKYDRSARAQLNCISEGTGGKYYDANTSSELIDGISKSVNTALSGRIILKPGTPVKNIETLPELQPIQPQKSQP